MKVEVAESFLYWEDNEECENYVEVGKQDIVGTTRWSKCLERVFQDKRDNTFWKIAWHEGLTEMQDQSPSEIRVFQVYPKEVTKTIYVRNVNES